MYAGRIVEIGPVQQVIHDPQHPYYRPASWARSPAVGQDVERLPQIEGSMPAPERHPCRLRVQPALPARLRSLPRRSARCCCPPTDTHAACWLHDPQRAAPGAAPDWSEGAVHG
jgi:peptide/nickel transport system ATP-binding protein